MEKNEIRWALFLFIAMLFAYVIPYTFLRNVDAWYGSFLLWTLFAFVIIIANVLITKKWSD